MTTDEAIKFLGLQPEDSPLAVAENPFIMQNQAEKEYVLARGEMRRLRPCDLGKAMDAVLEHTNEALLRKKSWEALIPCYCHGCRAIILEEHEHCPTCGKILAFKEVKREGEALIVEKRCVCGYVSMELRELKEEGGRE